jgi:glycosyltransferase involved in cell wall biosynthesis
LNISVCMASYNGSKYIKNQITSILNQLAKSDQLVIVDDCSFDNTVNIIESLKDSRIKLFKNTKNIGVVGTFNRALKHANGDIIFLSDQDDEWLDNKVSFIKNFFISNNIDMVVHDAKIMQGGSIVTNSLFDQIGSSSGLFKNIYSNSYTGCCMVFRRIILRKILPIPNKKGIFHDAWIGILAKFYKFKVIFIATPLIVYNRHEANVSTMKRRSIHKIIPDRINLIVSLIRRIIYGK